LQKGFEASFLVLKENPLVNIEAIKQIELYYKDGRKLEVKK